MLMIRRVYPPDCEGSICFNPCIESTTPQPGSQSASGAFANYYLAKWASLDSTSAFDLYIP